MYYQPYVHDKRGLQLAYFVNIVCIEGTISY
jgi:hypothetical protein